MMWTMLLIAFALTVLAGAGLAALLVRLRPQWTPKRRMLVAASGLPAATLAAALIGVVIVGLTPDEGGFKAYALLWIMLIGGGLAQFAFLGGLLGAMLSMRQRWW